MCNAHILFGVCEDTVLSVVASDPCVSMFALIMNNALSSYLKCLNCSLHYKATVGAMSSLSL